MIRFLQTPGPTKKIVLGGLLVVICAAMVITLIPGGFLGDALGFSGGGEKGVLAKVGDQQVTTLEVQQEARRIGRQQFPKGVPAQLLPFLQQRAAEELILQKAMLAEAGRLGLRVSDEEVQDELQHGAMASTLFPNGTFIGQDRYERLLQDNGFSVPQFEQSVKEDLLRRKLQALVSGGVTVAPADVEQEFRRQNTKVKFEYAVLTLEDMKKLVHPSDAELRAYYEKNKQLYVNSIPEKRKVNYALIGTAKLAGQVQIARRDLQRYYEQHRDDFRQPEEVNVRHILIKTANPAPDGKVDQKAVDAAGAKAEDILKQLKGGADFAELARKYSEDPGSAKNGGSLGWIGRGRTVPEFEQTAFSLPKGQTSEVVRTTYGFHIIHVDDKHPAEVKTLDQVRGQIEPTVRQEKAARAAESLASKVQSQARTAGLDKAATANGLQLTTTDFFSRTDSLPGVGSSPEFTDAVFMEADKAPPDVVQVRQGYVVFQLVGIRPPATPSFDEIRSRVQEEYINEQAATLLSKKGQELSDRAKAEHNLKKAAKEVGATLKTSELVSPQDQVPDLGAMSGPPSVAFTMKPGEISGPIRGGSDVGVLALSEKQEPTAEEFAKAKDQVRDSVLQRKRQDMLELFASNLRERMEKSGRIKINQQEMKLLVTPRGEAGE